jgi:hypothetical protein
MIHQRVERRGRRADSQPQTVTIGPAEIVAKVKATGFNNESIAYGISAAVAGAGILATVGCGISILASGQPIVFGVLTALTGSTSLFFLRGALRLHHKAFADACIAFSTEATLRNENDHLRDRIWELSFRCADLRERLEGAVSEDNRSDGVHSSSSDTVIPINGKRVR